MWDARYGFRDCFSTKKSYFSHYTAGKGASQAFPGVQQVQNCQKRNIMTPAISTGAHALTSESSVFSVMAVLMIEIFYMLFYPYDDV